MKRATRLSFITIFRKPAVRVALVLFGLIIGFFIACLNFTEPSEIGLARNRITGNTWSQDYGGWHLSAPWVFVAVIDTRPMRVSVTTTGRGYSAKLVQFQKEYWREFIATEGFRYYWWANRFSFNWGYDEEYRGLKDIMRGYAYSAKKYPFIKVLTEYQ